MWCGCPWGAFPPWCRVSAVSELLSADRTTLFVHDIRTDELVSQAAVGLHEIRLPASQGIAGALSLSHAPLHSRAVRVPPLSTFFCWYLSSSCCARTPFSSSLLSPSVVASCHGYAECHEHLMFVFVFSMRVLNAHLGFSFCSWFAP